MYLVANFKFLNLTWDLNVGVARIGNNRFQEQINDLEISLIYVHSDEMVYSKMCNIIWKNPKLYKCIDILMGGFHQLRVKLYKCIVILMGSFYQLRVKPYKCIVILMGGFHQLCVKQALQVHCYIDGWFPSATCQALQVHYYMDGWFP